MAIITDVLQYGTGSHPTASEAGNFYATDFFTDGVVGAVGNTGGFAPSTGSFAINAQGTPDATVAVTAGTAYVTATPTGQSSQRLRVRLTANQNVTISANATGGTRYDFIYLVINATNAANPNAAADNVATLVTQRSTSAATDSNGAPSFSYLLAVVTVANGFSTITNSNITDKRVQSATNSVASTNYNSEFLYDFVASGCVWSGDAYGSTRNASMTSGVVYIAGKRLTVAAVVARSFTASKDVYVDLKDNGDGTAVPVYYDNTTNAASPSFATTTGTVRIAIIVTGASNIANAGSVNQGEETKVLPIASSIPYAVTDSLGNLICPRDPNRKILGYRQITSSFTSTGLVGTADITGLLVPVIVPSGGRRLKVTVWAPQMGGSVNGYYYSINIQEGSTVLTSASKYQLDANDKFIAPTLQYASFITGGSHTYKATHVVGASSNVTTDAGATQPAFIMVELV